MSTREKILATVVVIFFVCVVVWAVRTTPPTPPPMEKVEPPTVMEYEGNTLVEEKDGRIIWELTCEKMRLDMMTQNVELDGVSAKFHQLDKETDEEKTWELTAAKGVYYQVNKVIHVEGDVLVTNSDGAEMKSDKLDWFADQEMLIANGNVKISKDDMRAYGDMAYSQTALNKVGLMGNAKITKGVKDDEDAEKNLRGLDGSDVNQFGGDGGR